MSREEVDRHRARWELFGKIRDDINHNEPDPTLSFVYLAEASIVAAIKSMGNEIEGAVDASLCDPKGSSEFKAKFGKLVDILVACNEAYPENKP